MYLRMFSDISDISVQDQPDYLESAWHLFVIKSKFRDDLQRHLTHSGIGTLIHYPVPPHHQKAYLEYQDMDLPIASMLSRELLSVPLHPHLREDEVNTCIMAVRQYFS